MISLAAKTVTKVFGGLTALSEVSIEVRPGEIHGLIGPNGSGKTTLLNALSGYYLADAGRVTLGEADLTRDSVQRRAFAGVARTFQKPRLLPTLSVIDNVMLGGWPAVRSTFFGTALSWLRARREERTLRARAEELLHGVGLAQVMTRRASLLEHAEQRFAEIARGLMASPRFLLLDEPAGGLTPHEIEQLGVVIRTVRDAGIGVLLVEHHTDFVFRLSDRVTALDLGRVIRQGTPAEVRHDAEVIRVYLGA
ncbi:MAG: ABC transporter ATP-binding protein [Burkholderiales bacterium]|nr:ABC transporter ATP-binding protein [Burkholderiales bacterium]